MAGSLSCVTALLDNVQHCCGTIIYLDRELELIRSINLVIQLCTRQYLRDILILPSFCCNEVLWLTFKTVKVNEIILVVSKIHKATLLCIKQFREATFRLLHS